MNATRQKKGEEDLHTAIKLVLTKLCSSDEFITQLSNSVFETLIQKFENKLKIYEDEIKELSTKLVTQEELIKSQEDALKKQGVLNENVQKMRFKFEQYLRRNNLLLYGLKESKDCTNCFDLRNIISSPTRITKTTATLLDVIFLSNDLETSSYGNINIPQIAEHHAVYCQVENNKSILFRKQWELDEKLMSWDPPEVLKLYHPSGTSGYDKDGAPIIIIPFKGFDPIGFLNSSPKINLVKMAAKILETNLRLAIETGDNQIVVIFDMEGFDIKQYASRPAAEIAISLIQLYEANYPEILKQCYIINAPRVFAIAFNVVKRFMNGYTLSKIQIYKSERSKWEPVLLSNITKDNLPAHYGGNLRDPDGNPKYTTVIKQGGKIPKSFYTKNVHTEQQEQDFTKTVIKKGNKLILDFMVVEEGCYLRWDFKTEGHDIRFGITLKDENGVQSPVVRFKRVSSDQRDESGVIACQSPATYIVTFDNSYSFFRNKKLQYRVFLTPPIEKLDIIPTDYDLKELKSSLEEEQQIYQNATESSNTYR